MQLMSFAILVEKLPAKLSEIAQRIFHWKYTSVIGVGIWMAGVAAMLSDKYSAAFIFYAIGGLWLLGWWLIEHPAPNRKKAGTWTKKQNKRIYVRWGGAGTTIGITALMCLWTLNLQSAKKLEAYSGWLEPGDDPTPSNNCEGGTAVRKGITLLFLGNHGNVHEVLGFPHTVLLINGMKAVVLSKSPDGLIAPIIDIRSPDGKIVVRMNDTEGFVVNLNNELQFKRPDHSTLIVTDEYGREVLNAKYLNRQALKITGVLTIPGYGSVPLDDGNFSNSCTEVGPQGQNFNADLVLNFHPQQN